MEIRTTKYEWEHGKKPRGWGRWAVRAEGRPRRRDEVLFLTGTITEVAREMRKAGATSIEILP